MDRVERDARRFWRGYALAVVALMASVLFLAGCHAVPPAIATISAPVIASQLGVSEATLSATAKAGCAAQQAANAAADIAAGQGSAAWVKRFEEASKLAGFACTWL